ncbi:MetQ/NlpA family ABC transporter substrate-binding protein [Agrobacterium sp. Ap1]|uniref:MetQ/NlpA family ABC transporter substrate-binding protein n=1 Tax=Agrobacterium sp. Ap1 TaxID=2815337 RepID=UPI001A8FAE7B|nr:MetQ/NlpA family ABC transporter substrate-binding protein [Agrobacterium sp. Ap1]MBO0145038.1 MetQ/NlpA family ABC transporter substrate-binding protein [Agrobacterium sp. Ap1]
MKLLAIISAAVMAVAAPAFAETVKIGVVPGVYGDSVEALVPEAKAAGIDLQVTEFSDWTTPNEALQAGDLDLNYFQHKPFLANAVKQKGYEIVPIGVGTLANIGIYSLKYKDFASVPDKAVVAIANDPVNQGRGLLLLERGGLIKLKDGVGSQGTLDDIVENPKHVTFNEVEGPQLARVTGDVDLALGYPHFIIAAKTFDPGSALIYSGIDDKQFAIVFAANKAKADNPALKKVVELYQNSKVVREAIDKGFASNSKLYTIAW